MLSPPFFTGLSLCLLYTARYYVYEYIRYTFHGAPVNINITLTGSDFKVRGRDPDPDPASRHFSLGIGMLEFEFRVPLDLTHLGLGGTRNTIGTLSASALSNATWTLRGLMTN